MQRVGAMKSVGKINTYFRIHPSKESAGRRLRSAPRGDYDASPALLAGCHLFFATCLELDNIYVFFKNLSVL